MDNLAKDAFLARQNGMSYGQYMANKKPAYKTADSAPQLVLSGGYAMNLVEACELMRRYIKCPKCGCETVGAGTGTLDIDTEAGYFIRTCHCGWKIEIREETGNG